MNIVEAKASISELLTDFNPIPFVPEGVTPPVVVIRDGNPYLEPGRTFGDYTLNLSIVVVGPPATNEESSRQVDQNVMDILPLLEGVWAIDSVEPELLQDDSYQYPAVTINIHNQVKF